MFTVATSASLLALAGSAFAAGLNASTVAELTEELRLAPTKVDQSKIITDELSIFDFNGAKTGDLGVTTGVGGHTVAADSVNFPAVIGNGVSMTIGYLGPCGMNTPHTHPRATEINFSLNTTLRGGVLIENGARFAEIDIRPGTATIFPQGAIHFEMNPSCEEAMFVAGFNGENPGVQQVAQRFFGLPPDIVGAALGGLGVQEVLDLEAFIPDNVVLGVDECLQRCGIQRSSQPTAQRQPRVSANAYPPTISAENVYELPGTAAPPTSAVFAAAGAKPTGFADDFVPLCDSPYDCDPVASSVLATAAPLPTAADAPAGRRAVVEERSPFPEVTQIALRR
ncbi:unnamed protein product [Peniophora sp. CBMAI 1063]|nr:unnamed protein product [Peniophora sp. CBMAI 1063]